jgi:pilus assembly protein FimV
MIVLDRLVRSLVAPPTWKSAVLTGSIAVLAAMSLNAQAQRPPASSHAAHAAGVSGTGGVAASAASDASNAASAASDLPPMPDHYQVQKGQWLTDIAGELTDSTDPKVKQNMANALYAANPDAFFANNPNRLKIGAVLKVPHSTGSPASGATTSTADSSMHAAPGTASGSSASVATAHAASVPVPASMPTTAVAAAASSPVMASSTAGAGPGGTGRQAAANATATTAAAATTGAMAGASATAGTTAVTASATPGTATVAGVPASAAAMTASTVSGEGGASASLSSAAASSALSAASSAATSSVPATAAVASDTATAASGASATALASGAHAWTGAIAPPPAPPPSASDASTASSPATSQNVSSLQQLLQLKNRVLAAMQAHGLGSHASAPAAAGLPVSSPSTGASSTVAQGTPQPHTGALQGPLAIPALIVVLIVVALAIWICLPARKRKPAPNAAPPGSPSGTNGPDDAGIGASQDNDPVHPRPGVETLPAASAGVAAAGIAASAAYAAQAPSSGLHGDPADEAGADSDIDVPDEARHAQDEPPFSLEEGAAGGLPTHDPQRRAFAEEARTPYDTGLLLGLLEMHAHRREVSRFEELAHELWELTDGEGPDWRRAAGMGRGIDPDNPLYADDPYAAYRSEHAANSGFAKPLPDIDLDLPEVPPIKAATPVPDPAAFEPDSMQHPASGETLAASPLPEATQPAHVPVSDTHERLPLGLTDVDQPAPSVADEIEQGTSGAGSVAGLGAGRGFNEGLNEGLGAGAPRPGDPAGTHGDGDAGAASAPAQPVTSGTGAPNFGALKLDFDLELTPNAAAPGSSPTSHDLATIARNKLDLATEYIDLGDRAGARTLLNEVLATQDPATRERAQALLATLA